MPSSDSLFLTLPLYLQRLVDKAFDLTADPNHTGYDKVKTNDTIPERNQTLNGAGGFLVESRESHPNPSGSFVEDDIPDQNSKRWSSISLSSIPSALQLLDLPPDDPEVLSVFRNAATGWTSGSITSFEGLHPQEKVVSREDWRSVCAVLLEHRDTEISSDELLPRTRKSRDRQGEKLDNESYIEPESGSDLAEASSDEYMQQHMISRKEVQDQNRHRISGLPLQLDLAHTSSRQRETCLKTFALFFPDIPHHQLADHRIMIKDLQRVSKLLGEKIKAEEMVEMLSTFSTSPDKSVSFDDFSRIMVVAKLA